MISVIFHDIFSRFPKGTEKTEDEGKVLSYEEFELTSEYLKKNNIDSFSENLPDDLKNRGVYCSSKYDKVIVISRSIVVEQMLWGLVYSNVYYYGGLAMSKNIVLDFLKRKGFNVPDFVVSPSTREELFDKLGDDIVAKPIEHLTAKGKLVHRISTDRKNIDLNRWLFQKYVGKKIQPSWRYRVASLFGKNILYYGSKYSVTDDKSYDKISKMEYVAKRWFDGAKFLTTDVPTEILKMSEEVSKALTKEFRGSIFGIDYVVDDDGVPWIVECNSSNTSLSLGKNRLSQEQKMVDKLYSTNPIDINFNVPQLISKSCINFIENLND
tara:strand:+ start:1889 stop:2863 length:975 start_codon:yes stop_codon:yes gene_type:complete